jgi:hypothetical protein
MKFQFLLSLPLLFVQLAYGSQSATIWRTTLPQAGQSGVCLHGDNLYLTIHAPIAAGTKGLPKGKDIIGQCYSRKDGKLKWEVHLTGTVHGSMLEAWHDATSLVPVANDDLVVFHNLNGMLLCCGHSGNELWKRPFDAPSPDIKNSRMFLHGDTLVVALPSKEIAVQGDAKHEPLPFYQIHGIDLKTGKDRWVSPVLQSHATQYSIGAWNGKPVIATSLVDLSHWQFGKGNHGYLLSIEDGSVFQEFEIPKVNPHQKNQLVDNAFLLAPSTAGKTHLQLFSTKDGSLQTDIQFAIPDNYFSRVGNQYELEGWRPKLPCKLLQGRRYPMHSTLHAFGDKVLWFASASNSIGCYDLRTKTSTMVDVPMQVLGDREVWDVKDLDFAPGLKNSQGQVVYSRSPGSGRGPHWGGFGHMNPAWPVRQGNTLFWQGGLGTLYRIDLDGDFSPCKVKWAGISPYGGHWTFGAPAVDGEEVYLRSQLELVKIGWDL